MNEFINFIKKYISIDEEIETSIRDLAIEESFHKNYKIVEEGKTCKKLYFLIKGAVRTFFYQNGKEITHWIYLENSIFTSLSSYISQQASTEYIEATENCSAISISFNDWERLYKKHPKLERFGRLIMEEQIANLDYFYKGYYFLSAKEKYNLLIKHYPNVLQKANLGHIASMLGISQETLSRIRGK